MTGYNGYSMSNNAVSAYENGLRPASKIAGIPAVLIAKFMPVGEWHHTSKTFNRTRFYNPNHVRIVFGLDPAADGWEPSPEAVNALACARDLFPTLHLRQTVTWIEWAGSFKNAKPVHRHESGCTVSVKGQTATVTLPNGGQLVKRLATRGFSFGRD